jgi:hypothetical protein
MLVLFKMPHKEAKTKVNMNDDDTYKGCFEYLRTTVFPALFED